MGDVAFVDAGTSHLSLAIKRGEGVEFEQDESFDGGAVDFDVAEGAACFVLGEDSFEEFVAG